MRSRSKLKGRRACRSLASLSRLLYRLHTLLLLHDHLRYWNPARTMRNHRYISLLEQKMTSPNYLNTEEGQRTMRIEDCTQLG